MKQRKNSEILLVFGSAALGLALKQKLKGMTMSCWYFRNSLKRNVENAWPLLELVRVDIDWPDVLSMLLAFVFTTMVSQVLVLKRQNPRKKNRCEWISSQGLCR